MPVQYSPVSRLDKVVIGTHSTTYEKWQPLAVNVPPDFMPRSD